MASYVGVVVDFDGDGDVEVDATVNAFFDGTRWARDTVQSEASRC